MILVSARAVSEVRVACQLIHHFQVKKAALAHVKGVMALCAQGHGTGRCWRLAVEVSSRTGSGGTTVGGARGERTGRGWMRAPKQGGRRTRSQGGLEGGTRRATSRASAVADRTGWHAEPSPARKMEAGRLSGGKARTASAL